MGIFVAVLSSQQVQTTDAVVPPPPSTAPPTVQALPFDPELSFGPEQYSVSIADLPIAESDAMLYVNRPVEVGRQTYYDALVIASATNPGTVTLTLNKRYSTLRMRMALSDRRTDYATGFELSIQVDNSPLVFLVKESSDSSGMTEVNVTGVSEVTFVATFEGYSVLGGNLTGGFSTELVIVGGVS